MSGRVYAVASGKGGVGKTTTTINLGVALRADGHRVAVVDADLGMANLGVSLGAVSDPTLHDVLGGEASLDDALVEPTDGFGLLVGDTDLSKFAAAEPSRLTDVVDGLAERYDFVLVDSGAGLSYEDVLPIGLADTVLLVSMPDPAAIEDTRKTAELVSRIGERTAGVVVTRVTEETDPEAVAERIGVPLLAAIPSDDAIPRSLDAGQPLEAYAPDSAAAAAYRGLAAVIAGAEAPPATPVPADAGSSSADADPPAGNEPGTDDGTGAAGGSDAADVPEDGAADEDSPEEVPDAADSPADSPEEDPDAADVPEEGAATADPPADSPEEDPDADEGAAEEGGEGEKPGLFTRVRRLFG